MRKVCHLTTVHNRYDKRILRKECRYLSNHYEVYLIVADGQGDELYNGVNIRDVGKSKNRFWRMLNATRRMLKKAILINANLYHIHDSELWPIAMRLKRLGKKVIFDAHEDFPNDLYNAPYLNDNILKRTFTKHVIIPLLRYYQKYVFKRLDALIAATPYIQKCIEKLNSKTVVVYNYFDVNNPFISTNKIEITKLPKFHYIVYGGTISSSYGVKNIVESLKFTKNVMLYMCGRFASDGYRHLLESLPEWQYVSFLGTVPQDRMAEVYKKSNIAILANHDTFNYQWCLPTKLFEFMYYRLPVIVSDLPGIRPIVEKSQCGFLVKPNQADTSKQIANCINYLIEHPLEAKQMGENGRKAILEHYNMNESYKVLLNLYNELLK